MAKVSKEELARREGIGYAIRYLEQGHTLDELKKDAQMRGAYNVPVAVSKKDMRILSDRITDIVLSKAMDLSCFVLRTEWKFGSVRIARFRKQMNNAAKDMNKGILFRWNDIDYLIEKELGLTDNKEEATA